MLLSLDVTGGGSVSLCFVMRSDIVLTFVLDFLVELSEELGLVVEELSLRSGSPILDDDRRNAVPQLLVYLGCKQLWMKRALLQLSVLSVLEKFPHI